MNELIGIRNINHLDVDNLKRDFLFFDKIFVVGMHEWKEVFEQELFANPRSLLEIKGLIPLNDFVIYNGLIEMYSQIKCKFGNLDNYYEHHKTDETDFRNNSLKYLIEENKVVYDPNLLNKSIDNSIYSKITTVIDSKLNGRKNTLVDFFELCNLCHDLKVRVLSATHDKSKHYVLPCESSIYPVEGLTDIKQDVYHLILDDFPIINVTNVSWEEIFNFKNDNEAKNAIWGLRNWISTVSKSDRNIGEIEEEYRYLKYKYESAINLHKLKTSNSVFQTVIHTTAELIENIAKFKIHKLSHLLFRFKENQIALMETELNSEGNQLSYLFKVNQKFKHNN